MNPKIGVKTNVIPYEKLFVIIIAGKIVTIEIIKPTYNPSIALFVRDRYVAMNPPKINAKYPKIVDKKYAKIILTIIANIIATTG